MNAHLAALGRLIADPEQRMITAVKAWARARMAIAMPQSHGADEDVDPPTLRLGITIFGHETDELLGRAKGECVSLADRLELRSYKPRDGESREDRTCIADSVIDSRSSHPRGGGKSEPGTGGPAVWSAATPDPVRAPLDDPIEF